MTGPIEGLDALEARIAYERAVMNQPAAEWVPPRFDGAGRRTLDVLVVGGGMCGATAALHLRRLGMHNIRVIDQAPAGREGPWLSFARMETLRSPKHLTGPASGLPNLTFRAWYEAQHGAAGWGALGNIPREMWSDYMAWFTRVTGAGVESGVRLLHLERDGDAWRAGLEHDAGKREIVTARAVVLATGREGLATPRIPESFAAHYGAGVVHTGDAPPRDRMTGRDVVVIGLGASAFDYAAEALEAGARTVKILGRSKRLARVNKAKQIVYAGFVHGYPALPDRDKLSILQHIFEHGIAPPKGTAERVMRHDNVELLLGAPVMALTRNGDRLDVTTPGRQLSADLIILGTGFRVDVTAPAYLAGLAGTIRTWQDAIGGDTQAGEFLDFPYLGPAFEFLPREAMDTTALGGLYCFNHAAMLSLGNLANDIPAVSEGAERLSRAIAVAFFLADKDLHLARLNAYEDPELLGDEVPGLTAWWPAVAR